MIFSLGVLVIKAVVWLIGLSALLFIISLPFRLIGGWIDRVKARKRKARIIKETAEEEAREEAAVTRFNAEHPEAELLGWHFPVELEDKLTVVNKGVLFPADYDRRPNTEFKMKGTTYTAFLSQVVDNTLVMFFDNGMVMRIDLPFKLKSRYIFGKIDLNDTGEVFDMVKNVVR
ncbi:hypothetical protein ACCW94_02890 [Enterobacter soli]|uniref:hypothetical protein n=1 Tax=Enterobacter soli TaxID=885040 RepID=UPI003EDA5CB1